ncbi:hypothetical protein ACFFHF_11940, partial [Robertmurraya beringensis]
MGKSTSYRTSTRQKRTGRFLPGFSYRLYLIIDIFSRKIVGWEIWESEEAKHAEDLMKKTIISEKIQ